MIVSEVTDILEELAPLSYAEDFDNVLWIGREEYLGDLFKAWDDGDEKRFNIYIGVKGDEFN